LNFGTTRLLEGSCEKGGNILICELGNLHRRDAINMVAGGTCRTLLAQADGLREIQ